MLTGGALALFVATAFAHTSDAADLTAANAALLEKYFADVNTRDLDALKEVISENYIQHGPGQGHGLAGMGGNFNLAGRRWQIRRALGRGRPCRSGPANAHAADSPIQ
jgi:hypothetical protein